MIDYRALIALEAVVKYKGFDNAAKNLFITQSAVSQRIKQLESQLGEPLILRKSPPEATALGHRLINHLQTVQHMETDLQLPLQDKRIHACIAVTADAVATWFAQALSVVSDHANIELVLADQDAGIELMKRGEVLACLCSANKPVNGAKVDHLGIMRYRAYASPAFQTKYSLKKNLLGLKQAPCLIFNEDDRLQHAFLKKVNLPEPKNTIHCPSSEGFIQLAIAGCGFGLMPEIQTQNAVSNKLLIDLTPDNFIDVPLFWHTWQTSSSIMGRLKDAVIKTAQEILRK